MSTLVATHNGPFHADDVMAFALIRTFYDADAEVVRTRDPARIAAADLVIDVGGLYDPASGRFDHHQSSYTGPLSAAGMVLEWLADTGRIDVQLRQKLRDELIDYVDAVDNGRIELQAGVPCYPRLIDALNQPAETPEDYLAAYLKGAEIAALWVSGLVAEHNLIRQAEDAVPLAMQEAVEAGRNVIFFDRYYRWKPVYFNHGGESHPTEYTLFPGTDGTWRIVCIPPRLGAFSQKRSLPESWGGLLGADLEAVTGVHGAVFCHKNRFIAVFQTREGALRALDNEGLLLR